MLRFRHVVRVRHQRHSVAAKARGWSLRNRANVFERNLPAAVQADIRGQLVTMCVAYLAAARVSNGRAVRQAGIGPLSSESGAASSQMQIGHT